MTRIFAATDRIENLQIKTTYTISPINENVTITAETLSPEVDQRNDSVYKNTLFGRDDQIIQSLNAGINAGQHEGGGKSLEIRRFGFNLDHGGVNGGVKMASLFGLARRSKFCRQVNFLNGLSNKERLNRKFSDSAFLIR